MRQYVGYRGKEDEKLVGVNFFPPSEASNYENMGMNWKMDLISPPNTDVRSDYHGFFDVLVDLKNENCLYFTLRV